MEKKGSFVAFFVANIMLKALGSFEFKGLGVIAGAPRRVMMRTMSTL